MNPSTLRTRATWRIGKGSVDPSWRLLFVMKSSTRFCEMLVPFVFLTDTVGSAPDCRLRLAPDFIQGWCYMDSALKGFLL